MNTMEHGMTNHVLARSAPASIVKAPTVPELNDAARLATLAAMGRTAMRQAAQDGLDDDWTAGQDDERRAMDEAMDAPPQYDADAVPLNY